MVVMGVLWCGGAALGHHGRPTAPSCCGHIIDPPVPHADTKRKAALHKLVEKTQGVLSEEIAIVLAGMRMGRPRRQALRGWADRLPVPEAQAFVNAIVQGDRLGVPTADFLRSQSDFLRLLRRQRAKAAAMKVPIKMLLPRIRFILPARS